jgi:signal transduction histidine kinase
VAIKNNQVSTEKKSLLVTSEALPIQTLLDSLPCAAALWNLERSACLLNGRVRQLTGFTQDDVQHDPSLWTHRIHPWDYLVFSTTWKRLKDRGDYLCCDYRFFPKGNMRMLRLREVAVPYHNRYNDELETVLSVYTDITDLRRDPDEGETVGVRALIEGLVHEVQNALQGISLGVELLAPTSADPMGGRTVVRGIERASRLLREVREYFSPSEPHISTESPMVVVQQVAQQVAQEWPQQEVHMHIRSQDSLPPLRLGWHQFRRALEQVLTFSYALLAHGGELIVEVGLQERGGQQHVSLTVTIPSPTPLPVGEHEVFQPFLQVNRYSMGLGLVLARQILSRRGGALSFHKPNAQQGVVTLLLKAEADD